MADFVKPDFKELCNNAERQFPRDSFNAHYTKRQQLNLLRERIAELCIDYRKDLNSKEYLDIAAIYIEYSSILAFSQTDLIAEIINTIVMHSALPPTQVDLHRVGKKLSREYPHERGIISAIREVLGSHEYGYLKAFVNMVRHRGCSVTTYKITNRELIGFGIKEFNDSGGCARRGYTWRELFAVYDTLFDGLMQIGKDLSESRALNPQRL